MAIDQVAGSLSKQYILLMYAEEGAWPPEEHAPALAESVGLCRQLHDKGQYISAAPLQSPATATCVCVRDGSRVVANGPFAETREQLGGYFLIDVANLDEAIAIAARIPGSRRGTAEIRPLFPLPQRSADRVSTPPE
ncbi:MAG: YciI family protein [Planctomycetales bacterium]|nr:YciI family protein [Planctomycetales bacterium]